MDEREILTKIEYIQETKEKIKNTIRQAGVPVSDLLEFRRYPDRIKLIGKPLDESSLFGLAVGGLEQIDYGYVFKNPNGAPIFNYGYDFNFPKGTNIIGFIGEYGVPTFIEEEINV